MRINVSWKTITCHVVTYDEGKSFSDEYGVQFFETSDMTGGRVEQMFTSLATEIKHKRSNLPRGNNVPGQDRHDSEDSPPIDQEDLAHERSDPNDSSGMSPKRHTKKQRRAATDQADSSSSQFTLPRVTPLFPGAITALDLSLERCTASRIHPASTSSSLSDWLQPHQHTIFPPSAGSSCIRNTVWLTNGQS